MKINEYELIIASSPEREKVFCEIYYQGQILGEISQEEKELLLEIYSCSNNLNFWAISLEEFQKILEIAKKHLLGE